MSDLIKRQGAIDAIKTMPTVQTKKNGFCYMAERREK